MANTNGVLLQLDQVGIAIWAENERFPWAFVGPVVPVIPMPYVPYLLQAKYSSPLTIKVLFDLQNSTIGFNPMTVTLESKGKILWTKGFYSDLPARASRCSKEGEMQTKHEEVILSGRWACFWLEFDRSSSPKEPFVLRITGITQNGKPVMIPSLQFQEGAMWWLYGVP